ncbi:hypothetical protein HPP92_015716 [Vanilla planifolia]|uniref:beta-glucosidase n=1 Tax=Vanilla planifolia TaxID=51239 RepID=A0A835QDH8_VANPL|nr:hypothetical protein HPP92_015716 [Vanilla planifolia]
MGLFENPFADYSLAAELGKRERHCLNTKVVYNENPDEYSLNNSEFAYAIVAVGELPYAESYGDNLSNLTIPAPGLSTVQNVCSSVKCVVVLISGRPLVIEPYIEQIDAMVAAWLPGTEGQGITDVLTFKDMVQLWLLLFC